MAFYPRKDLIITLRVLSTCGLSEEPLPVWLSSGDLRSWSWLLRLYHLRSMYIILIWYGLELSQLLDNTEQWLGI